MANKQYPQGCGDGEAFRDDDIIGVYKPSDTPDVVDGSLNKKKTWLQVKTWIQDFVINTNTANIAQNTDDIDVLENLVNQDVKNTASPTFFDVVLNTVGSVRLAIIDLLSRMTNTENATGINTSDIFSNSQDITALETKTPQSYKTTDDVTFNKGTFSVGVTPSLAIHDVSITISDVVALIVAVLPDQAEVKASGSLVALTGDADDRDTTVIDRVKRDGANVQMFGTTTLFTNGLKVTTVLYSSILTPIQTTLLTISLTM